MIAITTKPNTRMVYSHLKNRFLLAGISAVAALIVLNSFSNQVFCQRIPGAKIQEICETEACKITANRILKYMDPTVNPCDNFYRFACGNFVDSAVIRPDSTQNSSFDQVNQIVDDQLKTIVLEPSPPDEPSPYRTMKKLYGLCMDEKKINAQGVGHAVALLQASGGWPVLGGWKGNGWSILETEIRLRQTFFMGGGGLFQIGVSIDTKNTTRRVIKVDQAELGLPRELLIKGENDKIVQAYYSFMVDLAVMYGAEGKTAMDQLKKSLLFEIELAKITVPREERREYHRMYNPYKLRDLMVDIGWINWRELLRKLFPLSVNITDDELIIVNEVGYLKKLESFVKKYPNEVVANYMLWNTASAILDILPGSMRDRYQEFLKVVIGRPSRKPRWKECVNVAARLSIAVSSLYVKRFFDENSKKEALDITKRIRQEMYKDILELDWMDEKTRTRAEFKASKIVEHIGYPKELVNVTNIELFYKMLTINDDTFFLAMLDLRRWSKAYMYGQLREPVIKTDWRTHSDVAMVNAFYSRLENSMQFPAGILQQPFFSSKVPKYVNYATIGFIIGHEITHGFDDQGSQFDHVGDLNEWWEEESKTNFKEKKKCIIEQYGKFTDSLTHTNLNGVTGQGENVADVGGLKLSYRAYRRLASQEQPEPLLPGLTEYSQDQLFMLSMANMLCTRYRPEALKFQITTGVHSPAEFRVNGVLMNHPEFSQVFQCSQDHPMNPPQKCSVW